jgi:hypothetical protein
MPDWYSRVRSALQSHFHVVELRYRGYDTLGKVRVASFRGAFILSVFAAGMIAWLEKATPLSVLVGVAIVSVGLLVSVLELYRRQHTIDEVVGQLGTHHRRGREHHIIAHSFGTFLLPRVLMRTTISLQTVVLAGSVLPCRYDWRGVWQHASDPLRLFHRIRNEFSKDLVVAFAGWGWALTGCGRAGSRGFSASKASDVLTVHDVTTPWGPCRQAADACSRAPIIHNVDLGRYGHSGVFLSGVHAKDLWLPSFWLYEPYAYQCFALLCGNILEKYEDGYPQQADELCGTLLEQEFAWFGTAVAPRSVRVVVENRFEAMGLPCSNERLLKITRLLAELMTAGWQGEDPDQTQLAYPLKALAAAIDHTVQR